MKRTFIQGYTARQGRIFLNRAIEAGCTVARDFDESTGLIFIDYYGCVRSLSDTFGSAARLERDGFTRVNNTDFDDVKDDNFKVLFTSFVRLHRLVLDQKGQLIAQGKDHYRTIGTSEILGELSFLDIQFKFGLFHDWEYVTEYGLTVLSGIHSDIKTREIIK